MQSGQSESDMNTFDLMGLVLSEQSYLHVKVTIELSNRQKRKEMNLTVILCSFHGLLIFFLFCKLVAVSSNKK